MKPTKPTKPTNAEWFTAIGGWLVVWKEGEERKRKQFGDCTSSNLLFTALRAAGGKERKEPPSYKLLPEVIRFLKTLPEAELKMYQTITDGMNFVAGFESFAAIKDGKVSVTLSDEKYKKSFIEAMTAEVERAAA